jgi:hypothetical protein
MGEGIMVNFNGPTSVDMKLTMDLKVCLLCFMGEIMVNFNGHSVDMKLTMDLKDHSPISVTWEGSWSISMDQASVDMKLTMNLKDHAY